MNASDNSPRKKVRLTLSFLGKPVDARVATRQDPKQCRRARVSGPYYNAERDTYRLVVFDGVRRKSVIAASEKAALKLKAELEQSLEFCDRTVGSALEEFLEDQQKRGCKPLSIQTWAYKLRYFLPLALPLNSLTAQSAKEVYEAETHRDSRYGRPIRAQTHQSVLRMAKYFFKWAIEKQYVAANPFEKVKPVGKAHAGKHQLRIDEGRHLTQVLVNACEAGEEGAIAAFTQLLLGMRTMEVLNRQVRDLDDGGKVLWIPYGKTDNARRRLEVPEILRPYLLRLVEGQAPDQLLFGKHRGHPYKQIWLWRQVRNYCERANLPRICPHSLRGLHSSLAVAAGCTSSAVASALGHGSFAITAKHYVDADTLRNTAARRVAGALTSSDNEGSGSLLERLRALSPEERAALLRALGVSTGS